MAGGAFGEGGEEFAGVSGSAAYVVFGLTEGGMGAEEVECLGQAGVVGEVRVEELEEARVGGVRRVGLGAEDQDREGGDAFAEVGAGGLAGLAGFRGDVEDVVGQLEGDADLLAEGAQ